MSDIALDRPASLSSVSRSSAGLRDTVTMVDRCCGMDGTWGMKREHYAQSLEFARKAVRQMEACKPDAMMTDCTMSALQIEAVRGEKPLHPLTLLRRAYGLAEEL